MFCCGSGVPAAVLPFRVPEGGSSTNNVAAEGADEPLSKEKFAHGFYVSHAWIKCRRAYAEHVGGLCERCFADGKIVPGTQVHHRIRLTPDNINKPEISLNWKNLELLCDECHQEEHKHGIRWRADQDGHVDV